MIVKGGPICAGNLLREGNSLLLHRETRHGHARGLLKTGFSCNAMDRTVRLVKTFRKCDRQTVSLWVVTKSSSVVLRTLALHFTSYLRYRDLDGVCYMQS